MRDGKELQYDVYCDESYPDLFSSKNPKGKYLVIGSIWLDTENRDKYKRDIHEIKDRHKMGKGEFKWNKISRSRYEFYMDIIDWFILEGVNLRFRCIVVESSKINLTKFHNNSQELGFYKFYYQLLHHWILDKVQYNIFCDYKTLSLKRRSDVLKSCLSNAHKNSMINRVQAIHSEESVLLQLTDLLVGLVSAKFNQSVVTDSLKGQLIVYLESKMGSLIGPTNKGEEKFNVFKIELRRVW